MPVNSELEVKGQESGKERGDAKELLKHSTTIFLQSLFVKAHKNSKIISIIAENSSLAIITIYMQYRRKYYQKWGHQSKFCLNRSCTDSSLEHPPAHRLTAV